jgi:hypothetical protein
MKSQKEGGFGPPPAVTPWKKKTIAYVPPFSHSSKGDGGCTTVYIMLLFNLTVLGI